MPAPVKTIKCFDPRILSARTWAFWSTSAADSHRSSSPILAAEKAMDSNLIPEETAEKAVIMLQVGGGSGQLRML